jgi:D-alanyl-D-alanine carboxypeptidase/D-alanyl-D-alanine-endopeptidase (penicillin-binding protein 4)
MKRNIIFIFILLSGTAYPQALKSFLSDSSLTHASYSLYVADALTGKPVLDVNSEKSLKPASVLKLITSAAALELLGPHHSFKTTLGYTGTLNKSGKLEGDLVIKGGGDPAFASSYFVTNYFNFPYRWVDELKSLGIKKITGGVITDDSYFDYQPVPPGWIWEDPGNYYGAGVYGASIYDNSYDIHFSTSFPGSKPVITDFVPEECRYDLINYLVAEGTTDKGYVFAAPYSTEGWIAGSIPANKEDFVLSASIPDPPLLFARIIDRTIKEGGIETGRVPTTVRIEKSLTIHDPAEISEFTSPALYEIIEVLNHESVNLYAETLVKELGKRFMGEGTTKSGLAVIGSFLDTLDINGMFIVDGSGLSPSNSINSRGLTGLLIHMKNRGRHFDYYLNSLPDAGKEGTLKNCFKDDVFNGILKAKSGSMTRVRSYAGYFTTKSGREMVFSFISNDFSCPPGRIVNHYETILKDIIINY